MNMKFPVKEFKVLKRTFRPQLESLMQSPTKTEYLTSLQFQPGVEFYFIYFFFERSRILNQADWKFLVNTSELVCWRRPPALP